MAFIFICYCKSLLQSFPEAANQRCSANRMLSISSKIHKYQLYFLQGPFLTYIQEFIFNQETNFITSFSQDSCNYIHNSFCRLLITGCFVFSTSIRERRLRMQGGRPEGFTNFSKKKIAAQEIIDLNISWPSDFFGKYFMAPPINFSFLFKAYLQQYFRAVLTVILNFKSLENLIFTVIFKK